MKAWIVVFGFVLPLTACHAQQQSTAPPSDITATFALDPGKPEQALLEHVLMRYFDDAEGAKPVVCLGRTVNGKQVALAAEDAKRFGRLFPLAAPFDRCVWRDGHVVDIGSGNDALIFSVYGIECTNPRFCKAFGGWVAGNLGAHYDQFSMTYSDGRWNFDETGVAIAS
jgi:hypothetical protein